MMHTTPQGQGQPHAQTYRPDVPQLLRMITGEKAGEKAATDQRGGYYALPDVLRRITRQGFPGKTASQARGLPRGDGSILDGFTPGGTSVHGGQQLDFVAEVLADVRVKVARAMDLVRSNVRPFALPDGVFLEPQSTEPVVKQALASLSTPQQTVPQAQAAMNQFMAPPPAAPQAAPNASAPQTTAASPAGVLGQQTMTGVPQRPIGLDQPHDSRATAMPGLPGSPASNVIDQVGGLDPQGLVVDGNHGMGVQKFARLVTLDDLDRISEARRKGWPKPGLLLEPGERCQHCGAIHELGDDGKCNSCGKDHGKTAAAQDQGTDLSHFSVANWFADKEKRSMDWAAVQHHLPRIRPLDTAIGAGLGAGAGALSAHFADPDEEGRKPWLSRMLGGAALGAGTANLVGDRARRYLTNKLPLFGYDAEKATTALKPKSWDDFYQAAIADKRQWKRGYQPEHEIRRELLRRGMDLPPTSFGEQPYLESVGAKPYTPTETSGGLPGTFEHVQFSPEGWGRYLAGSPNPDPVKPVQQFAANPTPDNAEAIGRGDDGKAWYELLSRHGYRNNPDNTTSVHDLWDFALSPSEKSIAVRTMLGKEGPLNEPYSPQMRQQNNVGNWRSTFDLNTNQHEAPKGEILKSLAQRMGLQALTNGGVVLDQRFNTQTGQPVFVKQNAFITRDELMSYVPEQPLQITKVDGFCRALVGELLEHDGSTTGAPQERCKAAQSYDPYVAAILRRHEEAEANAVDTTYHYHCDCGWTGTHTGKGHPRSQKCPECGNPAHGGMPIEKTAKVMPFRPINADPDFIRENQAWHDAEKARLANPRPIDPALLAEPGVQNLLASLGLGTQT